MIKLPTPCFGMRGTNISYLRAWRMDMRGILIEYFYGYDMV